MKRADVIEGLVRSRDDLKLKSEQAHGFAEELDRDRKERAAEGSIAWAMIADAEFEKQQAVAGAYRYAVASIEVCARTLGLGDLPEMER